MVSLPGNAAATSFINFVNAAPTPFHAVKLASLRLENAGFKKVYEHDADWEVKPGKYFLTRNQSSLLAFTIPRNFKPGHGVSIVATHTDSPNLRIRPISKRTELGYLQVGVETYGSGIWHTWYDRDLSVAGRVVVSRDGSFSSKLVKIDRPILRIPSLAIHLDKSANDQFKFNHETEMVPILGLISQQLNVDVDKKTPAPLRSIVSTNHHSVLLALLADELSAAPEEIHDFELSLYDTQPAALGGINNEFIFSPRLDNLMSTFSAVESICEWSQSADQDRGQGLAEGNVGSVSSTGAESSLITSFLSRLSPTPATHASTIARSFLISADMSHAVHPNYKNKHEELHRPRLNGGIVVKTNAKQRYATDAWGSFLIRKLVEKRGGNVQEYEVRNDMACGSTVGPMLSKLGVRTVDVGVPMLSMHSIRETTGSESAKTYTDLFTAFFEGFAAVDKTLVVE